MPHLTHIFLVNLAHQSRESENPLIVEVVKVKRKRREGLEKTIGLFGVCLSKNYNIEIMKLNVSSGPELSVGDEEPSYSSTMMVMTATNKARTSEHAHVRSTDLQDSSITTPTETGSISEDESLGWLGGITADFKTLACTLKETAGGVANFVQRSAMAVASEIAHLEEEELASQLERSNFEHQYDENITLHLPWEVLCGDHYEEDEVLKEKIHALSTKEETFLRPYSAKDVNEDVVVAGELEEDATRPVIRPPFVLDEPRIQLVRRILDLDEKLATMHARLSGRSDVKEAVFWQNYFFNCELTREEYFVLLPPPSNPIAQLESFDDVDDDNEEAEEEEGEKEKEGSFVEIPSPPASQRSVGSLVVINPDIPHMP